MASDNVVEVRFGANVEGLRAGAREATGHVDSLRESLLGIKAEATQTGRAARFFANDLAALIPASDGAKGAIRDLFEVVLAGSAFGAVAASVKLVVAAFEELHKEGTKSTAELSKATDEWLAHVKAVHDETEKLRLSLRGISTTELQAYAELQPLREQRLRQQAALSKAEGDLAGAEIQGAQAATVLSGKRNEVMAAYTKRAHEALATAREELRITNEKIAALEKEFAVRARIASTGPLEKQIEEAKERAAQATEDSAINLARIQTEQEARDAREMEQIRLNVDEKKQLAKEVAEAQLRANEATEASEINKLRIYTEQETAQKRAKKAAEDAAVAAKKTATDFIVLIEHAFMSSIRSMIQGTADLASAGKSLMLGLVDAIIAGFLKMAAQSIIAAITAKAAAKLEAFSTTEGHIAEAVSGAYASQAFIPFVGPALGAAAAAETLATLEGITAPLLSAARGADLPAGGPFPMLAHSREMMLPEPYADVIRGLAGGGGGGGITIHVNAAPGSYVDAEGIRKLASDRNFIRGMQDARRRGFAP